MRFTTTLLTLLTFLSFSAFAQAQSIRISGKIIDSANGQPLDYATVTLQQKADAKTVNGATTDKAGRFVISDVKPGSYALLVEFIGYNSITIPSVVIDGSTTAIDLKQIALMQKTAALQNVTVTTTGRLVTNKIDRMIYNAEKDITSQSGAATDILRKVPQVSVDVAGNVELAGSTSIRFLINGKPSAAFGSSVADVLQSIPASQIKSIEVITNPGAKYDAQGLGGIINIILKQSIAQGYNGNVSLAAGTRNENGSFNLNARKGTFGVNAYVRGNYRPAFTNPSTTTRTSYDTAAKNMAVLLQQGASKFNRHGFQTGAGFDWTYKKHNSFTGSFSYNKYGNSGAGTINQQQVLSNGQTGVVVSNTNSVSYTNSAGDNHGTDVSVNYKRTFEKEDQELEIEVNTSTSHNYNTADNYQVALPGGARFYGNNSTNPGREKETEVVIDYTQPLAKDVALGVGGKYNDIDISSASAVNSFKQATGQYAVDPFLSNNLTYRQKVYAAYAELTLPVGKLFESKTGARYERTEINSFYSQAQTQVSPPGYNTFVPSVFLSKKLGDANVLKLSYSKRIERPGYGDLNPFVNTSDPKNLSTGNPYLLPEIGNRIEASYTRELGKSGLVMLTVFYRGNQQDIQPFIRYYSAYQVGDSVYTNVAVTMRRNIGTERNMGSNVFADLHPNSKLTFRTNLSFYDRHTINKQDPGYNSWSFNYRFNLNATYQFSPTLAAEAFGNFNSPRNEAQGRYPSFTTYNFAVRKQFWNKKGSLALTATNPFADNVKQVTEVFGPNFFINTVRYVPYRSFGLNFSWKFGGLEFKKDREPTDNGSGQGSDN